MIRLAVTVVVVAAFLGSGCGPRRIVRVVDPSGLPIAGAEVRAVSLSMDSNPSVTDAKGEAELPGLAQEVRWVRVSGPGGETVDVGVPARWPLQVTLGQP